MTQFDELKVQDRLQLHSNAIDIENIDTKMKISKYTCREIFIEINNELYQSTVSPKQREKLIDTTLQLLQWTKWLTKWRDFT